ncbi:hypothetical protein AB0K18_49715 [Nonomuraea sp. NPDC049421]|uniref:hypothetical protein n=1 Tax=Nonomuraea sp. NPDC049421 TaxID=3155275 RepID=UPI0034316502
MNEIDFYAQVATAGTILGIGVGSTPDQVESILGADFLDDRQRGLLRRDYGLLEFAFYPGAVWECRAVSVQVHRLQWDDGDMIPVILRDRFGEFSSQIKMSALEGRIGKLGCHVIAMPSGADLDFKRLIVQESGVEIIVSNAQLHGESGFAISGDVWSILLS